MVLRQFNLFPHLTVLENCTLAQELASGGKVDEAEADPGEEGSHAALRRPAAARPRRLRGEMCCSLGNRRETLWALGEEHFRNPRAYLKPY